VGLAHRPGQPDRQEEGPRRSRPCSPGAWCRPSRPGRWPAAPPTGCGRLGHCFACKCRPGPGWAPEPALTATAPRYRGTLSVDESLRGCPAGLLALARAGRRRQPGAGRRGQSRHFPSPNGGTVAVGCCHSAAADQESAPTDAEGSQGTLDGSQARRFAPGQPDCIPTVLKVIDRLCRSRRRVALPHLFAASRPTSKLYD